MHALAGSSYLISTCSSPLSPLHKSDHRYINQAPQQLALAINNSSGNNEQKKQSSQVPRETKASPAFNFLEVTNALQTANYMLVQRNKNMCSLLNVLSIP